MHDCACAGTWTHTHTHTWPLCLHAACWTRRAAACSGCLASCSRQRRPTPTSGVRVCVPLQTHSCVPVLCSVWRGGRARRGALSRAACPGSVSGCQGVLSWRGMGVSCAAAQVHGHRRGVQPHRATQAFVCQQDQLGLPGACWLCGQCWHVLLGWRPRSCPASNTHTHM
jgi:hypothetical protein